LTDRRSYRDSDAYLRSQSARRADGAPLWPLGQAGATPVTCLAEQRKQFAILERRVAASREVLPA
jgi:hypothetical protein